MVPDKYFYIVPDRCWPGNEDCLCWCSVLGLSFSAFFVLSQCWRDAAGPAAQPLVWTSLSLSGENTFFKTLLISMYSTDLECDHFIFSGDRHTGESFPRGGRVSQSPAERKIQVTATESKAMQCPWYEHQNISLSIKTPPFFFNDAFLSRLQTFSI